MTNRENNGTINRKLLISIMVVGLGFMMSTGYGGDFPTENGKTEKQRVSEIRAMQKELNRKSFLILKKTVEKNPGKNVLLSPYNIQSIFFMLAAGAKGETAKEIAETLGVHGESGDLFSYTEKSFRSSSLSEFLTFNAILFDKKEKLQPEYVRKLRKYSNGQLYQIDPSRPGMVAKQINAMVSRQTKGMIHDILSENMLTPLNNMFLLSTLSFQAEWALPFDKNKTEKRPFLLANGIQKKVQMMKMTTEIPYFHDVRNNVHGIVLPYQDIRFQFVAIKPAKGRHTSQLVSLLAAGNLEKWLSMASYQNETIIRLPKMSLQESQVLNSVLKEVGLKNAFSAHADFSGINGRRNLFAETILHTVRLDVDEEKTKAVSVTMIGGVGASPGGDTVPRYNIFYADSPFVVVIRDRTTEAILFAGLVNDPS